MFKDFHVLFIKKKKKKKKKKSYIVIAVTEWTIEFIVIYFEQSSPSETDARVRSFSSPVSPASVSPTSGTYSFRIESTQLRF